MCPKPVFKTIQFRISPELRPKSTRLCFVQAPHVHRIRISESAHSHRWPLNSCELRIGDGGGRAALGRCLGVETMKPPRGAEVVTQTGPAF